MEWVPKLDEKSRESLYAQLYRYFKNEIETSILQTNMCLPSIRYLADSLNISRTTVHMAYQQLLAEGYIESKERSGYYVAKLDNDLPGAGVQDHPTPLLERGSKKKTNPILYNFYMSDIDTAHFPLDRWRSCMNKLLKDERKDFLTYGERQGEWELRSVLSDYLHRARGVNCSPEQIVIGAGTQSVLQILFRIMKWNHKRFAMEEPGYEGARRVFQQHDIQVVPVPVQEDGLSIRDLIKTQADIVYITPSHQYPMGMIMPISKRIRLLHWAEENEGWIIEDDYDGEFRYRGKPIPSLQGIDEHGRVIYVGTFSKSLMPAIRVSYMVLPKSLLDVYRSSDMYTTSQSASRLHQLTLKLFMESGEWDRHIRKMRTLYRKKHTLLLETIREAMGEHVCVSGEDAGLHIVLHVKSSKSADELVRIAEQAGVKAYSTSKNWIQGKPPIPILLGFGGLSFDEIKQGIKRLNAAWRPYYR